MARSFVRDARIAEAFGASAPDGNADSERRLNRMISDAIGTAMLALFGEGETTNLGKVTDELFALLTKSRILSCES